MKQQDETRVSAQQHMRVLPHHRAHSHAAHRRGASTALASPSKLPLELPSEQAANFPELPGVLPLDMRRDGGVRDGRFLILTDLRSGVRASFRAFCTVARAACPLTAACTFTAAASRRESALVSSTAQ